MDNFKQIVVQLAAVVLGLWFGITPAVASPTLSSATKFLEIKVKRNVLGDSTSSFNAWEDVIATDTTMNMPSNTKILLVVRYNAVSRCSRADGSTTGSCNVRILVNGAEMLPNVNSGSNFDEVGSIYSGMHTIERSQLYCTGSNHPPAQIKVQQMVSHEGINFFIKNWHLTVEKYELPGQCNTN